METQKCNHYDSQIERINDKLIQLIELSEHQQIAIHKISKTQDEIGEMLTVYRHGRATYYTIWGVGKTVMFMSALIACVAAAINYLKQ